MNSPTLDPSVASALADFETSNAPSVWSSLDKNQVLAEMKIRLNDPFQVNQGQQPFCGPASILFELVRKQPLRYVQICRSLFETGGNNRSSGRAIPPPFRCTVMVGDEGAI